MKHILASLDCEEALEIERMIHESSLEPSNEVTNDSIDDSDYHRDDLDIREPPMTPLELWSQLQSYLVIEKSVELPEDESRDPAKVVITVYNTAPNSDDWPIVRFESVAIGVQGKNPTDIGPLSPGESKETSFSFPVRQLMSVEFSIAGEIDVNKLSAFRRVSNLPAEIITPLQKDFIARFESIGIKELIASLDGSTISPDMRLADVQEARRKLQERSEDIDNKREVLGKLFKEFYFDRESTLGARVRELVVTLVEFQSRLDALDKAIGSTDIEIINEAMRELKQVQLAVLRVEGAIREMTLSA